jgi:uncharacterized protein YjbJ (UPF0337 family)
MWNKDEIAGKGKQIEGEIKEKAGQFVTNPDLEAAGKAERFKGILEEKAGQARRHAGDAVEKAAEVIPGK